MMYLNKEKVNEDKSEWVSKISLWHEYYFRLFFKSKQKKSSENQVEITVL